VLSAYAMQAAGPKQQGASCTSAAECSLDAVVLVNTAMRITHHAPSNTPSASHTSAAEPGLHAVMLIDNAMHPCTMKHTACPAAASLTSAVALSLHAVMLVKTAMRINHHAPRNTLYARQLPAHLCRCAEPPCSDAGQHCNAHQPPCTTQHTVCPAAASSPLPLR
jgi:hypothetical protein